MKSHPRTKAPNPDNDNAPIRIGADNTSHVYVQSAEIGVAPAEPHAPKRKKWAPTRITTNLPELLPILPEEVALIRGSLADLVSRILANDNEPT